ncbi:hypothetical protein [Lysobacter gummosus]
MALGANLSACKAIFATRLRVLPRTLSAWNRPRCCCSPSPCSR